jgi:hypothetical protein
VVSSIPIPHSHSVDVATIKSLAYIIPDSLLGHRDVYVYFINKRLTKHLTVYCLLFISNISILLNEFNFMNFHILISFNVC